MGDDYEHKIQNGVLGIQKPTEIGTMIYMTPLGNGVQKSQANWGQGWGAANHSFWCCYGTAIESFSKIGDSIYFHEDTAGSEQLWVVQYVSSVVNWRATGLNITQRVSTDLSATDAALVSTITIGSPHQQQQQAQQRAPATTSTINLRIPRWAAASDTSVELNGQSLLKPGGISKNGSFLKIKAPFQVGDVIKARFGMTPRWEPLNDNRTAYETVGSVHYGPYLLVALSNGSYALKAEITGITKWLTRIPASTSPALGLSPALVSLRFEAKGSDGVSFTMMQLNRVVDELYAAHLNVSTDASQCLCGEASSCGNGAGSTASGTAVVTLSGNGLSPTLFPLGGATISAGMIRSGTPGQNSSVVMARPFVGMGTITSITLAYSCKSRTSCDFALSLLTCSCSRFL